LANGKRFGLVDIGQDGRREDTTIGGALSSLTDLDVFP
jgi:hypothetical protein